MKFYICGTCGNIIEYVNASGVPVICCGERMRELVSGAGGGAPEKHVPVVIIENMQDANGCITKVVKVYVGALEHPMTEAHYIQWIVLETTDGVHRICLDPSEKPCAEFRLPESEEVVAVYAYCNLHGLWEKK